MSAYTTKYRLTKPTVGGDADAWGGLLNSDMDSLDTLLGVIATGGSANAYTLTTGQSLTAYADGQTFNVRASFANTGGATMNIDAIGAKNLRKVVSGTLTALASGDIASGDYMRVSYNLASDVIVVHGGSSTLDATLVAMAAGTTGADVLWYWSGTDTLSTTTLTAAGRALLDDAAASNQRTTLGLGDAALATIGTSGDTVPKNNTANTFSSIQTVPGLVITDGVPFAYFTETGVTANNGKWRFIANGEDFYFQTLTDDELTSGSVFVITRTGTAVDSITFGATPNVGGNNLLTTATGAQLGADIVYTDSDYRIISSTSDGADSYRLALCGGGTVSVSRGGFISLAGNEHANTGQVSISAGNARTGAAVEIDPSGSGTGYLNVVNGDTRIMAAPSTLATNSAGFRGLGAPSVKTANYTFVIGDVGQVTRHNSASSHNFTIPTQASVACPNGAVLPVENIGAGTMVLVPDTGVTLLNDAGTSGSITLNQHHGGVLVRDADTGTNTWRYRGSHA